MTPVVTSAVWSETLRSSLFDSQGTIHQPFAQSQGLLSFLVPHTSSPQSPTVCAHGASDRRRIASDHPPFSSKLSLPITLHGGPSTLPCAARKPLRPLHSHPAEPPRLLSFVRDTWLPIYHSSLQACPSTIPFVVTPCFL